VRKGRDRSGIEIEGSSKVNWFKRSLTVIAMTTIYVLHRRHGARIAHILYKRYYSAAPAKASMTFLCTTNALKSEAAYTRAKTAIRE
jgi:hypothetical protein